MSRHWTERSVDDYVYRIMSDFVLQIDKAMEGSSRDELAKKLGVSKGRVSQIMNNPGSLSFKNVVKYARAINRKASLVLYEDGDPDNTRGPINSEIFAMCWQKCGRPGDFFDTESANTGNVTYYGYESLYGTKQFYGPAWTSGTVEAGINFDGEYQATAGTFAVGAPPVLIEQRTARTQ